jgi:hypothetical protein
METLFKINGIRLNSDYIRVTQEKKGSGLWKNFGNFTPLYQGMQARHINMILMSLDSANNDFFVSGVISRKNLKKIPDPENLWDHQNPVTILSVYPHHHRVGLLGFILHIFGRNEISFYHMASSNAQLTFVINPEDCDRVTELLALNLDLPPSHTPFEQKEDEELIKFLRKKYPETRATYVEEKIRTYGIEVTQNLKLWCFSDLLPGKTMADAGKKINSCAKNDQAGFFHTCAHVPGSGLTRVFVLTPDHVNFDCNDSWDADFISFHGPHFGDRHSIAARALECLAIDDIPVLLMDCTGASIAVVLPSGQGLAAKQALMNAFETP